jgi:two-component system sensor histidine kinase BaeS
MTKYKTPFWKTTTAQIVFAITVSTVIVALLLSYISFVQVNMHFTRFLEQQKQELGEFCFGTGRYLAEVMQEDAYTEMIGQFKHNITTSILLSALFSFIISLGVGSIISGQISSPLNKLRRAMRDISQNNYKTRVKEFGSDEIKELIHDFNVLASELERIENLRGELVSDVAHEVKTPLTKMKGQLEGILDGVYKPTPSQLNKILGNVNQLEYLLEQLQNFSELKAGKIRLKLVKLPLYKTIEDIISGYDGKDINFEIKIPQKLSICADKNKFIEIFDNLINNAYKYTEKGKITIQADKKFISISDNGPGISRNDLPYIFERFYRVEKSRNRKSGGLGLGLAIVQELVEAHGWRIYAESKIGQGTTFTIHFV